MTYTIIKDNAGNTRGIYPETTSKKWLKATIAHLKATHGKITVNKAIIW